MKNILIVILTILLIGSVIAIAGCDDDDDGTDMATSSPTMTQEPTMTDDDDMEYVYTDLTPAEAKQMIDENIDLIVIDVSPNYDNGHLPGAVNYYVGDGSLDEAIPMLEKEADYLVYCHVESVSRQGAQKLVDAGFMNVYRLDGDYPAWVDAGYPVEYPMEYEYTDLTPAEAKQMIDENMDLIVIDVSPNYDNGHLPGAVNYYVGDDSLDEAIPMLDKEADYLVYCHVESVSRQGAQKLVDAGFMNVYRLDGDYSAWVDSGYSVEYPSTGDESVGMILTIENLSDQFVFSDSGVFNTPVSYSDPGPLLPGKSYAFSFKAAPGAKLSFATMFVQSNDLFYAPAGTGIDLFDADGMPVSGDITEQILLWDAGTEVNEEPGVGVNQAPRQSGPDTGANENGVVAQIADVDDMYMYPEVADVIKVTFTPMTSDSTTTFDVNIENVSTETTLTHSEGSSAVPLAPGVWVIHTAGNPLFTEGEADRGEGLEAIAEDGDPSNSIEAADEVTGIATPFAPGVWLIHTSENLLFTEGHPDRGEGLEALAEDGGTDKLVMALEAQTGVNSVAAFDGPIPPGQTKTFMLDAMPGDRLSLATMFVESNDLFYGTGENGIGLFDNGVAMSGDITEKTYLWDAGTEVNEAPGLGPNQPLRQAGPDTGVDDPDNMIRLVSDGFEYPDVSNVIRVTLAIET